MLLEDYRPGERLPLGAHSFTEAEIVDFARDHDPQPFHVDRAAAEAGPYGGLIASGWHTAAIWMRLRVAFARERSGVAEHAAARAAPFGASPGFRDMVWKKPVRPGDRLSFGAETIAARPSASRPGLGVLTERGFATDQDGAEVFSFVATVFVEARGS